MVRCRRFSTTWPPVVQPGFSSTTEIGGEWRGDNGVAELGTERPVDPDGWFRAGSITKTFTAAAMLSLVADGVVGLDDTCERWRTVGASADATGAGTAVPLSANVAGVDLLELRTADIDGPDSDHADWATPVLTCS